MATGLSISRNVNVTVNLAPLASPLRNFGAMLVLGDSDVIDVSERIRQYADVSDVAAEFGTSAPEYKSALLHFSQVPRPSILNIAKWARVAVAGRLNGGVLASADQDIDTFTAVDDGAMSITIDGSARALTALDFSGETNLNGVASVVTTALSTYGTCKWDAVNSRFVVKSATTGTSSTVAFAVAPGSGTDVSGLMGLTSADGGNAVGGIAAETLDACIANLADISRDWYGLSVASSVAPSDDDYFDAAAIIEAASPARIMGLTTQNSGVLNSATVNDIASRLKAASIMRTMVQYSSSSPYAVASLLGRISTVNFGGNLTVITAKFKQEPGVTAEKLTATQANAAEAKNVNLFVLYEDGNAIIEQGVMANGYFIDEVHSADWFQNYLQTTLWNRLRQSPTKIPQTDKGIHSLVTECNHACSQAVANGWVAEGVWNTEGFGQLEQGQIVPGGYYVYAQRVADQNQADREARKSPPIQIAAKLSGAVHLVDCTVLVNR